MLPRPKLSEHIESDGDDEDKGKHSNYFVVQNSPVEAADRIDFPSTAKLVSDRVVGALKFHSGGHEQRFHDEAGQSFCLLLMEEQLDEARTEKILQDAEDLEL